MPAQDLVIAFSLTLLAGLSTGIGSTLAYFAKRTNTKFLCASLGFSAGVMVYVSLIKFFPEAKESLTSHLGETRGYLLTIISFFGGMLLVAVVDRIVPKFENPHEIHSLEELSREAEIPDSKLMRMGVLSALAITIHNFPEGMATFTASLKSSQVGISIAVAIAIHNIPEGIAVSAPIFYATGDRKKAFLYSFLSGLAEPLGAVIGYMILLPYLGEITFGILFSLIAGIMVFISFDGLFPAAEKYGHHHMAIYGLVSGMIVMAISMYLLTMWN